MILLIKLRYVCNAASVGDSFVVFIRALQSLSFELMDFNIKTPLSSKFTSNGKQFLTLSYISYR